PRWHNLGNTCEPPVVWWQRCLSNREHSYQLPDDDPRPRVESFRGEAERLALDRDAVVGLIRLAAADAATPVPVLVPAASALLAPWATRHDVMLGPAAGRRPDQAVEGLIGLFLDTLVLRTDLAGDPTLREALRRARKTALGAFGHPIPFPLLVEALQPERGLS